MLKKGTTWFCSVLLGISVLPFMSSAKSDYATFSTSSYTIYLVRHAEKQKDAADKRNPPLTQCGQERASQLADILKGVELEAVYSTDYKRTQGTAKAIADSQNLEIKGYDPRQLEVFSQTVKSREQTALIVGHSNTTNVVAGFLANKTLPQIDESEYDRLYQVTLSNHRIKPTDELITTAHFQLLHQAFVCK